MRNGPQIGDMARRPDKPRLPQAGCSAPARILNENHRPRETGGEASGLVALFHGLFLTLAVLVLLSPAVMPWYVLWALPAAVVAGNRWWPVFTGLALLSYLNYADGVGPALWWKWIEYGALVALVAWEGRRAIVRPRTASGPPRG